MPMAFLRAKPIGVMQMIDQGEQDDKARPSPLPCQCSTAFGHLRSLSCWLACLPWRQTHISFHLPHDFGFAMQIIAVHADDPEFKGFDDIAQLPKHRLAEIRR